MLASRRSLLMALPGARAAASARYETADGAAGAGRGSRLVLLRDHARGVEAAVAPAEGGELSGFRVRWRGRDVEMIYRARDYSAAPGWRGKAPLLWPATGRNFAPGLKPQAGEDVLGAYDWNGRRYPMPIHGFARSLPWAVSERSAGAAGARLRLVLRDSAATRRYYPFAFLLTTEYSLRDGALEVLYLVSAARGNAAPMFFSIGNHITFRVPFLDGSDARAMLLETPSTVEYLKTPEGLPTGASRPRSLAEPVRLDAFDARTAVSLGGYAGDPYVKLAEPAGLALLLSHHADSPPEPPVVQFNLWGDPAAGYFSPEPWAGLQNSLVLRKGLVHIPPGAAWSWRIRLRAA